MNTERTLERFQKNLDYMISQKTDPLVIMVFNDHYGEKYFTDEDAVEIR